MESSRNGRKGREEEILTVQRTQTVQKTWFFVSTQLATGRKLIAHVPTENCFVVSFSAYTRKGNIAGARPGRGRREMTTKNKPHNTPNSILRRTNCLGIDFEGQSLLGKFALAAFFACLRRAEHYSVLVINEQAKISIYKSEWRSENPWLE